MAYGTPASVEDIESFYTHIRRGRPPEPHQLAELVARYEAIGGTSPLNEITEKQVRGLERILNETGPNAPYKVYTGMKHAPPFIEETVHKMVQDGVERAIGVVLAPHFSSMSVGTYNKTASGAAQKLGAPTMRFVESWHMQPLFLESTSSRVAQALTLFPEEDRQEVTVLFTAHSLPERIIQMEDPYADQIRESAAAVAARVGHDKWMTGWQSAGRTADPWLGPDILDILRELHDRGEKNVLVCPFGFVSDHLEVLYDIDIEAQRLAKELGIHLERTQSPNDEELFLRAVAAAVLGV